LQTVRIVTLLILYQNRFCERHFFIDLYLHHLWVYFNYHHSYIQEIQWAFRFCKS